MMLQSTTQRTRTISPEYPLAFCPICTECLHNWASILPAEAGGLTSRGHFKHRYFHRLYAIRPTTSIQHYTLLTSDTVPIQVTHTSTTTRMSCSGVRIVIPGGYVVGHRFKWPPHLKSFVRVINLLLTLWCFYKPVYQFRSDSIIHTKSNGISFRLHLI